MTLFANHDSLESGCDPDVTWPARYMIVALLQLISCSDFQNDLFDEWWMSAQSNQSHRIYRVDLIRGSREHTLNGTLYRVDMDEPIFITAFHVIFASPHSGALLRSFPSKERSEFVFAESKNGLVAVILFDGNRVTLTYVNDTFLIASEKFETFVMKRDPKPEKEGLAKVTAFSFQGYRQWIVIWGAILAVAGFGFLIMLACDVCCGRRAGKRAGPQRRKED